MTEWDDLISDVLGESTGGEGHAAADDAADTTPPQEGGGEPGVDHIVQHATPQPGLIGREGLRVFDAAAAVMDLVRHAVDGQDRSRFYVYDRGVWVPENGRIDALIVRLLGNRHRHSNITNVRDVLRAMDVPTIWADPQSDWLNAVNGLVDWRTGELCKHDAAVLSTVQLPVRWEPDADCPAFHDFLAEVLPEDCVKPCNDGGPPFAWQLLGYLVYAGNPHHKAVLLRGGGRNGKGTFLHVVERLLGSRNVSGVSLLDMADNRFAAADMVGRIANIAGDIDPAWLNATSRFKMLTGGDTVRGEHKYGEAFAFRPWCVPVYSANDDFGSIDNSAGFFSRWLVVPFPNDFSDSGVLASDLRARLTTDAELSGILRHAAAAIGYVLYHGFAALPGSTVTAKQRFVEKGDKVRAWTAECCEQDESRWTARSELVRSFNRWVDEDGGKRLSGREFYSRLEGLPGITPAKVHGTRGFRGVRLKCL